MTRKWHFAWAWHHLMGRWQDILVAPKEGLWRGLHMQGSAEAVKGLRKKRQAPLLSSGPSLSGERVLCFML
jgi:hypothetical protein